MMGTGPAACRRACCTVITHGTDPMAVGLRLQRANGQHAREYYCSEEFIHFPLRTGNLRLQGTQASMILSEDANFVQNFGTIRRVRRSR